MMDREEQQHRNNVTLPRSCSSSAPGLSLLEGSAHLGPLNVLSNSDCFWLRASQPQKNMELCLVLSKCSQGLGTVMACSKSRGAQRPAGHYNRLLPPFQWSHQGEKRPIFSVAALLPKAADLRLPRFSAKCWTCWTLFILFALSRLRLAFRQHKFVIFFQRHHMMFRGV